MTGDLLPLLIIPAIDLKDGRCVRLCQGDMRAETIYSDNPAAMAAHWEGQGARLLHVVDLNGAIEGYPCNLRHIEEILRAVTIPVQVGGGIRSLDVLRTYAGLGLRRMVLGTAALQNPALIEKACAEFPQQILIGIDARDGRVAMQGWTTISDTPATDLLRSLLAFPLGGVIYTDISRDGMMQGPNLNALREIAEYSSVPVIASGGVTRVEDLVAIQALGPRIQGVIVGKALYEGRLRLEDAKRAMVRDNV
jgi:phosphoribosylformimino-5-aminoimidazole carboxamide ribotide isomerase